MTALPSTALVMIVRNEAATIARCLNSVRGLVDRMIVVDTGSTDATVAIAADCGAIVHHFAWVDDFSAARNAALAHSTAQWNLILDADDYVVGVPPDFWAGFHGQAPFIGRIPIANTFDLQGGVETAVSWVSRILPQGVRYAGRIHEQPDSDLPRRRCNLRVVHTGYRQQHLDAKRGRNQALLALALQETPGDPYLSYQAGKDDEIRGDYQGAVAHYQAALPLTPATAGYRHDIVVRTIYTMKKAQLHEAAIQFAESEYASWQHSPDFFFALGDLFLDWATLNPDQAESALLPIVESSWLRCLALGDGSDLEGAVQGRGGHLAAHNLGVLYEGTGKMELAATYRALQQSLQASS